MNLKFFFFATYVSFGVSSCFGVTILKPVIFETIDDPSEVIEKWSKMEKSAKGLIETVLARLTPTLIGVNSELSYECTSSMLRLIIGIKNMKFWAFQMLDAAGKIPSGILEGTTSAFGSYQECVKVRVPNANMDEVLFTGQYCTVNFRLPLPTKPKRISIGESIAPFNNHTFETELFEQLKDLAPFLYFLSFRIGVCIPSTCSAHDLETIINYVIESYHFRAIVPECETQDSNSVSVDGSQIAVIIMLSTLFFLALLGTGITYFAKKRRERNNTNETIWTAISRAFCINENAEKILTTSLTPENDQLQCLHGIRFYSISWIILGHTYLVPNFHQIRDFKAARTLMQSFTFQAIMNGTLSVDSFFFISGVLMSYISLRFLKTNGKERFNPYIIIFHRIWRLLPAAMIVLGIVLIIPLCNSGPLWHEGIDFMVNNTRNNWWTVPIFATNLISMNKMPLPHYWYIASDMQLFILAVIYLLLLLKKKLYGLIFNAALLMLAIFTSCILIFIQDLPPTMLNNNIDPEGFVRAMRQSYVLPHTHLGPYAIGLALGYFLANTKKIHLSIPIQICGWMFAIGCNLGVLYGVYPWNSGQPYSVAAALLYGSLHRPLWAVGMSWLVLVCVSGNGGIVNKILSWKALVPLSKLTYLAYLIHLPVMMVVFTSFQGNTDMTNIMIVYVFFGNLITTFGLAFLGRLLFEGPLLEVEKLSLKRLFKNKQNDAPAKTEVVKNDEIQNVKDLKIKF